MNAPDKDLSRRSGEAAEADRLDAAIDEVAARMVAAPEADDLTVRIVSALPERSWRFGWLIPQLTALGALAIAAVWWSVREQPTATAVLPSTPIAAAAALPSSSAREPRTVVRTRLSEGAEPAELPELSERDFEGALPAIELLVIGTEALPAVEALTLAPIEIGELPLTAETMSPGKFE